MKKVSTVLLVDDSENVREMLEIVLRSSVEGELHVRHARNAFEALNVLSHFHIDLVISDLEMPLGDGFMLLKLKAQLGLTAPTIIFSSALFPENKSLTLTGAVDCFSKAGGVEELLEKALRYLT